jgi:F-box/TPR repeat protein Pof3
LDTTSVKKTISLRSLKVHLRRSKFTLDLAILTIKAIDAQKLAFITQTCKMLKDLQMHGRGMIGESLTSALEDAKSLESLYVSRSSEITLNAVQSALGQCKKSLITVTFLNIHGPRGGFLAGRWPEMGSIRTVHFESDGESCLDIVGAVPADIPQG